MKRNHHNFISNKAQNLVRLVELGFLVPNFTILTRDSFESQLAKLELTEPIIIRSCIQNEDSHHQLLAGQATTIGPLDFKDIHSTINSLFDDPNVVEIIVQEFVDAPTGVLFCTAPDTGLLEYARIARAVTGGSSKPFVAVFPNDLPQYRQIKEIIPKIFNCFGACDIELALSSPVKILQARPLVSAFSFPEELARVQMYLQEIPFDAMCQDEFCHDLAESPGFEGALINEYCKCRAGIINEIAISAKAASVHDFIKIGKQIFLNQEMAQGIPLSGGAHYRLAKWSIYQIAQHWIVRTSKQLVPHELMRCALALRTLTELNERLPPAISKLFKKRLITSRNECRELLVSKLLKRPMTSWVADSPRLISPLKKDSRLLIWLAFGKVGSSGQIVVEGNFDVGPYVHWKSDVEFSDEKVILVCDELYPEIFKRFDNLRGIICEGGALTSHLAILARESQMPLCIQVPDALNRFLPNNGET